MWQRRKLKKIDRSGLSSLGRKIQDQGKMLQRAIDRRNDRMRKKKNK